MALAFLYPILAITVQWLAGRAIDFGGWEVIAASPPQARIYVLVWLGSFGEVFPFCSSVKLPMALAMVDPRRWRF